MVDQSRPCRFCRSPSHHAVCDACWAALPWNTPACPSCALPVVVPGACARCRRRQPPADLACVPFRLAPPVQRVLHGLKYHRRLADAHWLAQALVSHRRALGPPPPQLMAPVPLHWKRLWHRSYNQAAVLGRAAACQLGIPWAPALLTRFHATPDQIGQSAAARRRGVRGAFGVTADIRGRRVAVIDDVMTSGATLDEIARTLRRAGAGHVEVWAIARTPMPQSRFPPLSDSAMMPP
jgi:ComF family protein